jgi:hypothetical protein
MDDAGLREVIHKTTGDKSYLSDIQDENTLIAIQNDLRQSVKGGEITPSALDEARGKALVEANVATAGPTVEPRKPEVAPPDEEAAEAHHRISFGQVCGVIFVGLIILFELWFSGFIFDLVSLAIIVVLGLVAALFYAVLRYDA